MGATRVIVETLEAGDIKNSIDEIKNRYEKVAVLLLQIKEEKVMLAAGVKGEDRIKAGAWIKEIAPILGGGGGGRDDFAQAGGKDASKANEALQSAKNYALERLA